MRLPLTAIFAAAGLATVGCMEEEAAMFIEGALPLAPDECKVSAGDNVFLSNGVLDLGGRSGYTVALKVRTNLRESKEVRADWVLYGSCRTYILSTCSFAVAQNEEVVAQLLADEPAALLAPIEGLDGAPCVAGGLEHTVRFDPRTSRTSALFIAKIHKRRPA